ncbi:MAG: FtsX-like permease family protein, partial [Oscillospiraceae bacterium]|nr:FtsX-like permease family protein [Oscillospiraceae bacterium]
KALGFYNREILFKYLFYGVSGTFIGMLLGLLMGYLFIQRIMLSTYGRYYVFGAGRSAFRLDMTLVVFAAGILLSSLTVWSACSNLMRSSAISLMQGKVPQISWKPKESRQKAGSLYRRLVWLNMLSDKQRVAVTVVSIAGCCSLLVAGFTMKYSVVKALNRQFDEIEHYALRVEFDPDASADPEQAIRALLADKNAQSLEIRYEQLAFSADGKLTNGELVCGDAAALSDYYTMHDIRTNEVLTAGDSGIWIHKRTAEKNGLSAGDEITLYDDAMNPYTTHVAGIFNIFAGRQMVLSRESYHEIFGEAATDNAFLIICDAADAKSLCEQIRAIDGVDAVSDINELRATYQSFASVLDLIALLFIAIAGLMAYFILLNSVNMYVNQKKPELTVMRINGFTVREVIGYVSYELILSTIAGIVLGWLSGSLLGYRVIRLLESPYLQFVRTIQWESWIWAALITLLFSAAISFLALRKIPRLKLTDAL